MGIGQLDSESKRWREPSLGPQAITMVAGNPNPNPNRGHAQILEIEAQAAQQPEWPDEGRAQRVKRSEDRVAIPWCSSGEARTSPRSLRKRPNGRHSSAGRRFAPEFIQTQRRAIRDK